ncbi:MAG: hypothetical protein M1339_03105 [Bacteroidetes bacterium]|nr:hypothetical protein [Bacteroidota bacterium]
MTDPSILEDAPNTFTLVIIPIHIMVQKILAIFPGRPLITLESAFAVA